MGVLFEVVKVLEQNASMVESVSFATLETMERDPKDCSFIHPNRNAFSFVSGAGSSSRLEPSYSPLLIGSNERTQRGTSLVVVYKSKVCELKWSYDNWELALGGKNTVVSCKGLYKVSQGV